MLQIVLSLNIELTCLWQNSIPSFPQFTGRHLLPKLVLFCYRRKCTILRVYPILSVFRRAEFDIFESFGSLCSNKIYHGAFSGLPAPAFPTLDLTFSLYGYFVLLLMTWKRIILAQVSAFFKDSWLRSLGPKIINKDFWGSHM